MQNMCLLMYTSLILWHIDQINVLSYTSHFSESPDVIIKYIY